MEPRVGSIAPRAQSIREADPPYFDSGAGSGVEPMPAELLLVHWLTLHGLVTSLAVLTYVVRAHVMHQRRQPAAAIAWILFILLIPYLALPAFLLFGSRKRARPRPSVEPGHAAPERDSGWATDAILSLGQPAPEAYTDLRVHEDGTVAKAALFESIESATASLDVCTFILARDALGQAIVDRLRERAAAGVRVRLLVDGMGSLMARHPDLRPLMRAGATVARFAPPLTSSLKGRTNLRNHRKLLIADAGTPSARLWCGGRNLAAEYFDGSPGHPPWVDLSFDVAGPLVHQASALFELDWAFARGAPVATAPARDDTPRPRTTAAPAPAEGAQLVASGPDQADDTLLALLVTACFRSSRRIALASPYFVPDPTLLMALCLAARRGVQVDLLLPERSNHRLSDLARGRAVRTLAQAGGHVWLAPRMMHAKLVVIDDDLALAGSANLDSRSLLLNYELMVAFQRAADVRRLSDWLDRERASAVRSQPRAPGLFRDVAEGMLLWLGFQL